MAYWVWVWVSALALTAGCSSEDKNTAAHQACRDAAAAYAESASKCGYTYQESYDGFVVGAAKGNCDNVIRVRDSRVFYDVCVPYLKSMTCDQVNDPNAIPAECHDQLLY